MIQIKVNRQFDFLLIAVVFLLNGCATEHKLIESNCCNHFTPLSELPDAPQNSTAGEGYKKIEKHIGTNGKTDREFHPLALKRNLYSFQYDGFLIAVEKAKRTNILGDGNAEIPFVDINQMLVVKSGGDSKNLKKSIKKRLGNEEVMFVSHILRTNDSSGRSDPYNAYTQLLNESGPDYHKLTVEKNKGGIYKAGWEALEDKLRRVIISLVNEAKTAGTPYSHIIVISTGWHTNQLESVQAYNHLAKSLEYAAPVNFRPLYITFSWPSAWRNDFSGSFVRKRNDADEVGLLPANLLVNHVLLDRRLSNIPTVLIGHSFGARILTRALFSRGLLQSTINTSGDIDTLIGLQAAFSFKRFHPDKKDGSDGYPYRRPGISTEFIFTASSHDKAGNSDYAFWSREEDMILGKGGWKAAKKAYKKGEVNNLIFTTAESDCNVLTPGLSSLKKNSRIVYVDASRCVKDHNDIYRAVHGKLMRKFIH